VGAAAAAVTAAGWRGARMASAAATGRPRGPVAASSAPLFGSQPSEEQTSVRFGLGLKLKLKLKLESRPSHLLAGERSGWRPFDRSGRRRRSRRGWCCERFCLRGPLGWAALLGCGGGGGGETGEGEDMQIPCSTWKRLSAGATGRSALSAACPETERRECGQRRAANREHLLCSAGSAR